ncbi:MAG: shikimate dehydrogenase [Thermodesulfobacteriota bacterium]
MSGQIYGIVGHPLGHTLSPALHNWGFSEKGLTDKIYCSWPVEPKKLSEFMTAFQLLNIAGASVTIPHKEDIIPYLDELTPAARQIGAANTLLRQRGKIIGDNTDVHGFCAPLAASKNTLDSALVLGAGGASRAIVHGLKSLNIRTIICNRSRKRAESMAREMCIETVAWEKRHAVKADLLVNTTPLGMHGPTSDMSPWAENLDQFKMVYDIIYNPVYTPLLQQAASENKTIVTGLEMFVSQGIEQFRLWTGQTLEYTPTVTYLKKKL